MGSSSPDYQTDDTRATRWTGFARAMEDEQIVLVLACSPLYINITREAGAPALHRLSQHVSNRGEEPVDLVAPQHVGPPLRVDARPKKRLVNVDVAQARHQLLGHQQRLDQCLASLQRVGQILC